MATGHPSAKSAMSAAQALVSMATPFQVTERKRPQGERAREEQRTVFPKRQTIRRTCAVCNDILLNPRRAGEESVFP